MTRPSPDPTNPLANLDQLVERLAMDTAVDFDEMAAPFYWPSLPADDAAGEWESLRIWVERFRVRFPHAVKIPDCWYHHGDLVEVLSALRDHERASFSATAPPTAAVEWHRAFRDIEARYEHWIKRFKCQAERLSDHPRSEADEGHREDWARFVHADIAQRHARQIAAGLG